MLWADHTPTNTHGNSKKQTIGHLSSPPVTAMRFSDLPLKISPYPNSKLNKFDIQEITQFVGQGEPAH